MREIKFKTWFPETKKMTEPWTIEDIALSYDVGSRIYGINELLGDSILDGDESIGEQFSTFQKHIKRQYIGMSDKNSKEIYAGDIISTPYYTLGENGKEKTEWITCDVFYCEESLGFIVNPPGGRIVEITPDCEILGNIHQNPELLESKDESTPKENS